MPDPQPVIGFCDAFFVRTEGAAQLFASVRNRFGQSPFARWLPRDGVSWVRADPGWIDEASAMLTPWLADHHSVELYASRSLAFLMFENDDGYAMELLRGRAGDTLVCEGFLDPDEPFALRPAPYANDEAARREIGEQLQAARDEIGLEGWRILVPDPNDPVSGHETVAAEALRTRLPALERLVSPFAGVVLHRQPAATLAFRHVGNAGIEAMAPAALRLCADIRHDGAAATEA